MPIGLMSAMPEELGSLIPELKGAKAEDFGKRTYHQGRLWGQDVVLVFSRWGKVAAATTATSLVTRYGCDEIIFTGVAGGVAHGLRVGDVVVADRLVQHDMDARPLFERHEIPLLGVSLFETDDERRGRLVAAARAFLEESLPQVLSAERRAAFGIESPKAVGGLAASGDKFFASRADIDQLRQALPEVSCVEMEGAAVAQVCHEHGVPFSIVRTISDNADDAAHVDFPAFVKEVATAYSHGILERALAR